MKTATPDASSFGAWRVVRRVHHVGYARIDVAGDDDHAIRVARPALDRDDVHDLGRIRDALAGDGLGGRHDLETATAVPGHGFEACLRPASSGADAARVGDGVGERGRRPEADQLLDRRVQRARIDVIGDGTQHDLRRVRGRGVGGHRRREGRDGAGDRAGELSQRRIRECVGWHREGRGIGFGMARIMNKLCVRVLAAGWGSGAGRRRAAWGKDERIGVAGSTIADDSIAPTADHEDMAAVHALWQHDEQAFEPGFLGQASSVVGPVSV